jgi:hypothetical protein
MVKHLIENEGMSVDDLFTQSLDEECDRREDVSQGFVDRSPDPLDPASRQGRRVNSQRFKVVRLAIAARRLLQPQRLFLSP